jgi:hypothetical protein
MAESDQRAADGKSKAEITKAESGNGTKASTSNIQQSTLNFQRRANREIGDQK